MTPQELMLRSMELAERSQPTNKEKTPRLGVVIALNGVIIGEAHRGTGEEGDDDHAEVTAVSSVANQSQIPGSTVYTTLEPCTFHMRKSTSEACTTLLKRFNVGKVVVGILDPNQGICGRGVNELQLANIEVELYPHDFAQRIRVHNGNFIRAQQSIKPLITTPGNGEQIILERQEYGSWHKFVDVVFECNNPPGPDVFLNVKHEGRLWPQYQPISSIGDSKRWTGKVGIGADGDHEIHIVKANTLGLALIEFHKDVTDRNIDRKRQIQQKIEETIKSSETTLESFWDAIHNEYQGIKVRELSTGMDSLAHVTVHPRKPNAT